MAGKQYPSLNQRQQLDFTAHAIGLNFDRAVSRIKWHDGYMTFKDGSPQEGVVEY